MSQVKVDYDDRDPYYFMLVGVTWLNGLVAVVVGIALLMGWLPGLR